MSTAYSVVKFALDNSTKGGIGMEIESASQLESLCNRYNRQGTIAIADADPLSAPNESKSHIGTVTFFRYDAKGNKLVVTFEPGKMIQYDEYPLVDGPLVER